MPDQTAADRAAEVLLRAAPILYAPEREAIIAALMADPDLLVDLAIEAGALVEFQDCFRRSLLRREANDA